MTLLERAARAGLVPHARAGAGPSSPRACSTCARTSTATGCRSGMDGMRALDVGTWDGFWAFEMERRGARGRRARPRRRARARLAAAAPARQTSPSEPRGEGFRLAHEMLGSKVERVELQHLRRDARGARDLRPRLLRLGADPPARPAARPRADRRRSARGTFISAEEYDRAARRCSRSRSPATAPTATPAVVFWVPGARTWERMMWTAGFDRVERHGRFRLRATEGWSVPHVVHRASRAAG